MATLKEIEKKIEIKIKTLDLAVKDTHRILSRNKLGEINKHRDLFEKRLEEITDLRNQGQEIMLENDLNVEEVEKWGLKYNEVAGVYDVTVEEIEGRINEIKKIEENKALQQEEGKWERRRLNESQLQMKIREEEKAIKNCNILNTKLPKLIITKFNGTHIDWFRFWNQFETEIDRSELPPVSKFSYLKELISPKVRMLIDGLPFTSEGYARAKNILQSRYGQASEVANAHIKNVMSLPHIYNSNPFKIHEFTEKLIGSIQALETMGKLRDINGYVRLTLDKLQGIRADLVRMDDDWQKWEFPQLVESLEKWTKRNPLPFHDPKTPEKNRSFHAKQNKTTECVYCDKSGHKSADCETVKTISDRRKILSEKKLCFNCTGQKHRAADCRSSRTCLICKNKHHTSICDKSAENSEPMFTTTENNVIYPVAIIKVNGVKCRALLDTGSGSSYASEKLIDKLNISPLRKDIKTIETLTSTSTKKLKIYSAKIQDLNENFTFSAELNKLEREVLLTLPNPNYSAIIEKYPHLKGVYMNENDRKTQLPIHVILGASDFAKIKLQKCPRVGNIGEPFAEQTKMGWVLMSPGRESDVVNALFTKTSISDYEKLCDTDILGLREDHYNHDEYVYEKFKKQLVRSDEGWYETGLIWKEGELCLGNNKNGSIGRLRSLLKNLNKKSITHESYDTVIKDQLENNIIEKVRNDQNNLNEFYMPHKPVVRTNAESTKLRIVYDASSKSETGFSLNDCLEKGPPLQNKLWDLLIRTRFQPIVLCADIQKAFLQIRIRENERDCLRFHWVESLDSKVIDIYRFTRLVFGLTQSPFILEGTLDQHFENSYDEFKEVIEKIKGDMYVDDLVSGGGNISEVAKIKNDAIRLFKKGGFKLHKFHSNENALESDNETNSELNFAKQQLGTKDNETKILGVLWDKKNDLFAIEIPKFSSKSLTKRSILQFLASVFDPLGFISPFLLAGKLIYRNICDLKTGWDTIVPSEIKVQWLKWVNNLENKIKIPRAIPGKNYSISNIDIHLFSDASINGVCSVAYAVVYQGNKISQYLITSKSRLAKKNQSIPRLELTSAHMSANLAQNIIISLKKFSIRQVYAWSDSTVVLHWLKDNGEYKIFVSNRILKIKQKKFIQWKYVPTKSNPADLGSRGCELSKLNEKWWKGPEWLQDENKWPQQPAIKSSTESDIEKKQIKEVLATVVTHENIIENLLVKYPVLKTFRILSWLKRFLINCKKNKVTGPLTTCEIEKQKYLVIKAVQNQYSKTDSFKINAKSLNVRQNEEGIYKCYGRIQGEYPIFIPKDSLLAEKLIEQAHILTIHGGVTLTMAKVRSQFWIPSLRQIVKRAIKKCNGCKIFHAKHYPVPTAGLLPLDRTTQNLPFKVIGVDYAGPFLCKTRKNKEVKVYILLFTCSLSRAIHLEVLPDQTTGEFIKALKRLIARRGIPKVIYSDNAKTFVAASKWIVKISRNEQLHEYLINQRIKWKFNLSRAPWWGGQFERMVGLVKQCLFKAAGRANLTAAEFEEIVLDVEVTLNNRPLLYLEDDIQMPMLTPNVLLYGQPLTIPEEQLDEDEPEMKKRQQYIKKCKEAAWRRWQREYLQSLRERHNSNNNVKKMKIAIGDVVLIKGDEKNKRKWKIGIVTNLYEGGDGIIRAVQLKTAKSVIERPIQYLYPLELYCDRINNVNDTRGQQLDVNAREFRPRRNAAIIADIRVNDVSEQESIDE